MTDKEIKEYQDICYIEKFLMFIIYENTRSAYKELDWLYDIKILDSFKAVIKILGKHGCIRPEIKNNIYNILMYGRNIIDEYYKQRIELINETIGILNSMEEQDYLRFYSGQLAYRVRDGKKLKKLVIEDIKNSIPFIEESICTDYAVLYSHSEDITDEEFVKECLPELINNGYYYESLNILLKECPSLFKDEIFIDRMNSVIEMNKNLHPYFNKKSKNLKKRIRKYS